MTKTFITASLLLAMMTGYSQNKNTEKADKLFQSYQYVGAAEEYLKLAQNKKGDGYVYRQLADSYYNVFDMEKASKWYAKAVESKQDAETYYRYAQTLRNLGKYSEANKQMDKFATLAPTDKRAKDHKANPDYIPSLASNEKLFDVKDTKINSKDQADFGAVLANDNTLYFVSSRNTGKKTDKWIDQPYLDIYQSTRTDDNNLSEPKAVGDLNTTYHDGPLTISADGNTMFFARDSHSEGSYEKDKKSNIKLGQQGIYKATKVNGNWTNIQPLPINSTKYSVSNPSLSKDGKTLYFASNMPGGKGETDIWKISIDNNSFGKPQNLGAKINTTGRENFPCIADDNVLYFASSGRQGFGGLDVYKLDMNDKDADVINLGKPVNTDKDDFSFSLNLTKNVGYFSSNRAGKDNIYLAIPVCGIEAVATIKDKKTGKIIADAKVSILDSKGNVIATKQSNASGEVSYQVECDTEYVLQASKNDYDASTATIAKSKTRKLSVSIDLAPVEVVITDKEVLLNAIYFEYNKSNITAQGANELDKLVKVLNNNPQMKIFVKAHTDTNGGADYNLKLSDQRAQATVQYVISRGINKDRISGKGFGFTELKVNCKDCTEEQDAQNRRSEFLIVKD